MKRKGRRNSNIESCRRGSTRSSSGSDGEKSSGNNRGKGGWHEIGHTGCRQQAWSTSSTVARVLLLGGGRYDKAAVGRGST